MLFFTFQYKKMKSNVLQAKIISVILYISIYLLTLLILNKIIYKNINVINLSKNAIQFSSTIDSKKKEYLKIKANNFTENPNLSNKKSDIELNITIPENSGFSIEMRKSGFSESATLKISQALGKYYNNIGKGQDIHIKYDKSSRYEIAKNNNDIYPQRYIFIQDFFIKDLQMRINKIEKIIALSQKQDESFSLNVKDLESSKKIKSVKFNIQNSLYADSVKNGVTLIVIKKMLEQYAYDIDFQRDIHQNDKVEVVFEEYFDEKNRKVKDGRLLYSGLYVNGKWHKLYRRGEDFFDEKGVSIQKALLKTPVDGARISSTFGTRKHPVLGFTRAHKGVDFAAPTGTPVYAAGDGTVSFAGWGNGYGNLLSIKHNSEFSTNYAHLSRFAKGIKSGIKVRQRQVVAYIGTTGLSTGPHLHFELVKKGEKINPQTQNIKSDKKLAGNDLKTFMAFVDEMKKTVG